MTNEKDHQKDGVDGWKKAGDMSLSDYKEKIDNLGRLAVNVAAMDMAARQPTGPSKKEKAKKKRKRKAARAARRNNR